MRQISSILLAVGLIAAAGSAFADDASEERLRDALRNATTQQRAAEDQLTALQARLDADDKQNQELRAQNDTLRQQVDQLGKQPAPASPSGPNANETAQQDRAAMTQMVDEFNRRLSSQADSINSLNATVDKWKTAYEEAQNVARGKEAERAALASKVDGLTKTATTCVAKNDAMFKVANEILDKYAHVGFGDALGAREPFIGFERVKLQNIVQDYQDKILDQKAATQ